MILGVVDPRVKPTRLIHSATSDDIMAFVVEGIDYAVLVSGDHSHIQCAVREEPPHGYWLSYVGEGGRHHALDVPIGLDRVLSAFLKYHRGDASWRSDFSWEPDESET
jgi:hypothetical protein